MTTSSTALALAPLFWAAYAPGKEMLHPLTVVIFGGLAVSNVISLFLMPAVFYQFWKKKTERVSDYGAS